MKYAIIGLGFIYPRHKKAIEETGGEVLLTCDVDPLKNADFKNWKEMFASERFCQVDTVVICAPNYLHKEIAQVAIKDGRDVICEKPLSLDGVDGLENHIVKTYPVLQLRYHPEIVKLKEWQPKDICIDLDMRRGNDYWSGWKGDKSKSGGILYNLGIHYLDLLCYLLGDVKEINHAIAPDERTFRAEITFQNGRGMINLRVGELQPKRRLVAWKKHDRNEENCIEVNLSNKDNLSQEDLHIEVYKDFIQGRGVSLGEAKKSLDLAATLLRVSGR